MGSSVLRLPLTGGRLVLAVDWLLRSDIGEVIKEIMHDEEHFPDYRIPKKTSGRKKRKR